MLSFPHFPWTFCHINSWADARICSVQKACRDIVLQPPSSRDTGLSREQPSHPKPGCAASGLPSVTEHSTASAFRALCAQRGPGADTQTCRGRRSAGGTGGRAGTAGGREEGCACTHRRPARVCHRRPARVHHRHLCFLFATPQCRMSRHSLNVIEGYKPFYNSQPPVINSR